jgi:sigma-B regulation protein RsbU (phosphoserine phosphatase)
MQKSLAQQVLSRQPVTAMEHFAITVLLIDDQQIIGEAVRLMLEDQKDITFHYCSDSANALQTANRVMPTVILQDLVMPGIDGLTLVGYFRENPNTRDIPLIVLSSQEEPKVKAEAFALGANDYIVKLPDKVELIARIRYHSAAYIRLLERNQAYKRLEESQRVLNAELAEAASYVRSLLPAPIQNELSAAWRFIPSAHLGGDALGYYWMDREHFVFYLLDVCGHGIGAALLSITLLNVLRSQNIPHTDFLNPSQVLSALNTSFQMRNHNDMFFTIWYGVYEKNSKRVIYSSGGHPPAVLLKKGSGNHPLELTTEGLAIGIVGKTEFQNKESTVDKHDILYLFSDGVYELLTPAGKTLTLKEFIQMLQHPVEDASADVDRIVHFSEMMNGPGPFVDDFSILRISF